MTKREAAVISAFTGILCCKFSDFHQYVEQIMGRPVWTNEMGDKDIAATIKEKAKPNFMTIVENLSDDIQPAKTTGDNNDEI
jgi:hypothetical protein